MCIRDRVEIVGGVRYGRATGAPIALTVANRDAGNWGDVLAVEAPEDEGSVAEPVRVPRPGHADLGGALLYDLDDIRDVIERASARETAARVACGAVAKLLLETVGCRVVSHVVAVGGARAAPARPPPTATTRPPTRQPTVSSRSLATAPQATLAAVSRALARSMTSRMSSRS